MKCRFTNSITLRVVNQWYTKSILVWFSLQNCKVTNSELSQSQDTIQWWLFIYKQGGLQHGSLGASPFLKSIPPFKSLNYLVTFSFFYINFKTLYYRIDKIGSKWSVPPLRKKSWGQHCYQYYSFILFIYLLIFYLYYIIILYYIYL